MVHLNISHGIPGADVRNGPCQHAFAIMGSETLFAVHLTQYHCDKHRYQVVLRITLPETARDEYLRLRTEHPDAGFFFCNGETPEEKFSIPALGSGNVVWEGTRGVMHWQHLLRLPGAQDTASAAGLVPVEPRRHDPDDRRCGGHG